MSDKVNHDDNELKHKYKFCFFLTNLKLLV